MSMTTRIAVQNMKYHRSKNILIGIAIFLTTLLLFLIPTIGMDMIGAQNTVVNEVYPSWYALFRNVDADTVKKLAVHHTVTDYGLRSDAGIVVDDEASIDLLYLDEEGFNLYNMKLSEGTFPEKENEIVVSEGMLYDLGLNGTGGDTIHLSYQIDCGDGLDYAREGDFVITGMTADSETGVEKKNYTAFISEAFLQKEIPAETLNYRFLFQIQIPRGAMTSDIEYDINQLAGEMNIDEQNVAINDDYLNANYVDPAIIPGIVGIMCIIVAAGIITIYSIYYVGMAERIQEFGRIKAIGATKRQLRQIVLREGMAVACIAIPIGLVAGSLLTKVMFQLLFRSYYIDNPLMDEMRTLFAEGKISLFHPMFYLITIVVTLATVWLSLMKPMRIAARVSEMEAINYQGQGTLTSDKKSSGKRRKEKQTRRSYQELTVFRLAGIYMTGNKKNTCITIGAMAVTGVFVMVIATILSCADPLESANSSIMGQYEITNDIEEGNKEHPERSWKNVIQNNPINEELKAQIEQIPGVERVISDKMVKVISPQLNEDDWSVGGVTQSDERELMKGITEGHVTYEELESGDKVVIDENLRYWFPELKVGDKLTLDVMDGSKTNRRTVTIAAIGDYSYGFTEYSYMLMAEEGIEKLCPYDTNDTFHIYASEKYNENTEAALQALIENNTILELRTWKQEYDEWSSTMVLTNDACYAFLGILGAICIMNMINTMIHSVHLRKKSIGMMQAIGMTDRQLTKQLQIEGLIYTLGTLILSVGGGSLLGYPAFVWAKAHGTFSIRTYHYPTTMAIVVTLLLFALQMLLAWGLSRSVKKESLIERVRYSE